MSKDSNRNYVHWNLDGRVSELMDEFCRDKLPPDDIYVPPHHQPINPEDEEDIIPDQHAAFGIQRAQQKKKEKAWKDLGLQDLVTGKKSSAKKGGLPR
ncbi:hypothetical protein BJ508DRAFT_416131 [Ascobolus immersus RN42]|uniref:Uncharacterized protein n=1 Tax=Ascobolus immersus RN42 TaxID=1160509 RepID=A0A3N4I3F8_ASCIM|nr:hypothetical protein BJ508DRAFT_416131 [Ascobolus immersus RN42]